jgi:hypothetical protein
MRSNYRVILGLLLILAGALLTLQQLNMIPGNWGDVVFGIGYLVGTVFFISLFLNDRGQWWAALLGFIFLGLTLAQTMDLVFPQGADWGGAIFLLMIGLGFLSVYALDRNMWWAIIPGGVMLSLTALVLVEETNLDIGFEPAGILFVGMGLTFLALTMLRIEGQRLSWAIWPAIPLFLLGLFVGLESSQAWSYVWPSLIILLGLYFVWGSLRGRSG